MILVHSVALQKKKTIVVTDIGPLRQFLHLSRLSLIKSAGAGAVIQYQNIAKVMGHVDQNVGSQLHMEILYARGECQNVEKASHIAHVARIRIIAKAIYTIIIRYRKQGINAQGNAT